MTTHEQHKFLLKYYNPTQPVIDTEHLKGRTEELHEAVLLLLNGESVIVQGARRIGKTSLLHCLNALCTQRGQHCLYISFQRLSRYNVSTFIAHLQQQIISQFRSLGDSPKDSGELFGFFRGFGTLIAQTCSSDEYVILFFDEFQLTEEFSEEERRVLYNQLRNVIDEQVNYPELRRFVFVLSTAQSLSELAGGISSSLASSFSKTFHLGRLSPQSCRELIREPFAGRLKIGDDVVDLIITETGGHPYLIKLLLHELIISNNLFSDDVNFRQLVNQQVMKLTENREHDHFSMLKNLLNEVETHILYEIDKHQNVGVLDIRESVFSFLERSGKNISTISVKKILDYLENLQILTTKHGLFCFSNGIYHKWFSQFFEDYYVNEALQAFREVASKKDIQQFISPSSVEEFVNVIDEALRNLKTVFEEKGLWELAWKDKEQGIEHHERYLQKMTAALLDKELKPYNISVEREVESGVGPMDVKLSRNRTLVACLEMKKSIGDVYHGLETEMIKYMGSTIKIGFFVLFYLGGTTLTTMMNRVDSIVDQISQEQPEKMMRAFCIDCTPKLSASKRNSQ